MFILVFTSLSKRSNKKLIFSLNTSLKKKYFISEADKASKFISVI